MCSDGLSDDPETTRFEPGLCVNVMPEANCSPAPFLWRAIALHGLAAE